MSPVIVMNFAHGGFSFNDTVYGHLQEMLKAVIIRQLIILAIQAHLPLFNKELSTPSATNFFVRCVTVFTTNAFVFQY